MVLMTATTMTSPSISRYLDDNDTDVDADANADLRRSSWPTSIGMVMVDR
jgi:hypothetical protein